MKLILTGHYRDVTTDLALMQFVFTGVHREGIDMVTQERVERASKFLSVQGEKLYISGVMGLRQVPPIVERWQIL
jgi:hypothetical protein